VEDLTIRENLRFVARMYGMDDVKVRVERAIEGLGLADRARSLAGELSSGWKQRLAWRPASCTSPRCCCSTADAAWNPK